MATTTWKSLEPDVASILAECPDPIASLSVGEIPAIAVRQAFPAAECADLVRFLIGRELMYEDGDPRIEERAIPVDRADRYTRQGLNPKSTPRRRIDIGTSLGNLGDDKETFLQHSAETHALFAELFADRPNPVAVIYDVLQQLAAGKRVVNAHEPDGRPYGPAIFRVHYGGYTYGPHFDSVRNREQRTNYAVYKYATQLAGVLCVQNATLDGVSAQGIIHRQFWTPDVDPHIKGSTFHEFAAEHAVEYAQIDLEPGDLYFFNTGMIHEVPGVPGPHPRIVLATFLGYSPDEEEIMVWS